MDLRENNTPDRLATGLAWFSIGLGAAELLAPRAITRIIGVWDRSRRRKVLRAYGVREFAAGVGLLGQPNRSAWLWNRVAGDVMDLATLGAAFASFGANKKLLSVATASVLGVTALDVFCARELSRGARERPGERRAEVRERSAA